MPILAAIELAKLGLAAYIETLKFLQTPEGQQGLKDNRQNLEKIGTWLDQRLGQFLGAIQAN